MNAGTTSISASALVSRINRRLSGGVTKVHKSRSAAALRDLGPYYLHDADKNVSEGIDLEAYGRELDALRDDETLVREA